MQPPTYENLGFLEPNHDHNPASVIHLIEPPKELIRLLPDEVIAILEGVQDATSIAFASKTRFDDLVAERFDRLLPIDDTCKHTGRMNSQHTEDVIIPPTRGRSYSEPGFFQYQNQVKAEKRYLVTEALVDWHHKVHRLKRHVAMLQLNEEEDHIFHSWLDPLTREVIKWEDHAEDTDIPDFEETIVEVNTKEFTTFVDEIVVTDDDDDDDDQYHGGSVPMQKLDSGIGM